MISLNFNINIYQIQQDRMQNSNFMVLYSWQIERGVYMKKMFLHTAHIFCNGEFILIAKRLNEFVDPYDFYETLSKLMSDAEKFEEFLKAIAAK